MIPRNATPSVFKLPSTKRKFAFRYSFNGKEKENEIASGDLDFGARIYSAALGKFISTDPDEALYVEMSPYCYAIDNPVRFIDVQGRGAGDPMTPVNKYVEIVNSYVVWESSNIRYFYDKGSSRIVDFDLNGPASIVTFNGWLVVHAQMTMEAAVWFQSEVNGYADNIKDVALRFSGNLTTEMLGYDRDGHPAGTIGGMPVSDKAQKWEDQRNLIASTEIGKTFRHMAFQAYLTLAYGYKLAKAVGDFHEREHPDLVDSNFDLINNQRGRDFALANRDKYDLSSGASIASMFNDIADVVRLQYGRNPVEEGEKYFNSNQDFIKGLVRPK